jgi:hypothetical protein
MNVFVGLIEFETSFPGIFEKVADGFDELLRLFSGQQPDLPKHPSMRGGAEQVVLKKSPVGTINGECQHVLMGILREPPTPHRHDETTFVRLPSIEN